ncbi:hypothetical protein F442_10046 [Phytophthora nicotianae P10297]|uniref:Uncharacterized protein n=2 Tax=Phytophthora nicotianae TaxID=4792 RepID=W2R7R1_PHYN3|nr:hypothetical protein PPTG_01611 [Phytophthora nicotianae INRA-310]ETN21432.1 hypothetical protein PPTG_01611 [Phytophthora nicotianae INRA-310]ETP43114.1 hypothetical protein F442_10046 [Phytophthora nicotianae P10297]
MAPEQKHSQVQKTITTAAKKVLTSAVSEYTRSKSGNMLNKDIVAIGKVVYISDDDAVLRDMEETAQIDTRQVVNKCKNVGTGDGSVGDQDGEGEDLQSAEEMNDDAAKDIVNTVKAYRVESAKMGVI